MAISDWSDKKVIVTGGAGFLGGFVCQKLRERGVKDADIFVPRRKDFDLTELSAVRRMYDGAFAGEPTDVVIHLAAEVGGIGASEFEELNKLMQRLDRFWNDQILYRL